ncbi:hypothetical protein [Amycolatopsis kentuckyensis]|uniref:hypothetical protein n=1 Tax=Amycolatopsis kentuckyensis TaxID=218823 RepID=UPI0035617B8D
MRIRAVVFTTHDAPNVPRLQDAWDRATALDEGQSVHQVLADVLADDSTHHAEVVDLNVPDDLLLPLLQRPTPEVPGNLTTPQEGTP